MPLQPRRNNSDDVESLAPIDLLPVKGPQTIYPNFTQQQNSILHYWQILRKRKWAALATFAIVFTLTVIGILNATRLYQATSKVAIFPENPNVLGFKDAETSTPDFDYEATLETQAAILRSDALAMKVIEAMHLDQDPSLTGATRPQAPAEESIRVSSMQPDPTRAAGLLGAFRGGLSVQLIPTSRLVQISYTHTDPRLATEIVNGLVKTFIEENFKTKYESVTQTSQWLSTELADLQLKVQTSEEKLVRYQKDHSILGVDEKQNVVTEKLGELNKELTEAEMDRIEKEADYKLAINGDPSSFTRATPDGRNAGGLLDKLLEKQA